MTKGRFLAVSGFAATALLLAGCGKSATSTNASGGGSNPPASATVEARNVPGLGMVLVDPKGMTLYFLKGETSSNITCTGGCANAWPPFLIPAGTQPTAGSGVTGQLGTVTRPDGGGLQVTYDGSPLYTFVSDTAGQASGQGVSNFFAMSPTGTKGSTAGSNGGGYQYP